MPRVPTVDGPEVATSGLPGARAEATPIRDYRGQQLAAIGDAAQSLGSAGARLAGDMQFQVNKVRVEADLNGLVTFDTDLRTEASQLRGRNALERPEGKALPDEFAERLNKRAEEIAAGMGNDAQRQMFRSAATQMQQRMRSSLTSHMLQEQRTFQADTAKATIETAIQRGTLLWGEETERQGALGAITETIREQGKRAGWDKVTTDAAITEATTPLHAGVIRQMIAGGFAKKAADYYEANSAQMTLQARATVQPMLREANDAQSAEGTAGAVWSELGPKVPNDPIKQADMEAEVRTRLASNPPAMKMAIDGLRQRAVAHNAQQAEVKAQSISGVWELIGNRGAITPDVMRSEHWLSLTETERRDIRRGVEAEAYQAEQRAAARAARGAADASRELSALRTNDALALLRNGASYLTASDPDVLSKMSRAQVEAMRGTFGLEGTQQLLSKWEGIRRGGQAKIDEGRMDTEDFNMVAASLGMKPFETKKSDAEKEALGVLKYKVEKLIDRAQQDAKRTLTREEKETLMRREMAQTVTVDGFWSDSKVPVIQLTPDQLRKVVIPSGERAMLVDALRQMSAADPNNPAYAPTDENLRRLYVRRVSPSGALVPNGR